MGSVYKLLNAYKVGSKQSEAQKYNQNPAERRIQDIKGNTLTVLDHSVSQSWSWILCMDYVISIITCMAHGSLS